MEWELVVMIFVMFGVATYLLLDRYVTHVVMGIMLFSNAINVLLLLTSYTPQDRTTPIFGVSELLSYVDPLPHALALTAIVIGFGLLAFFITMLSDVFNAEDSEDLHKLFRGEDD